MRHSTARRPRRARTLSDRVAFLRQALRESRRDMRALLPYVVRAFRLAVLRSRIALRTFPPPQKAPARLAEAPFGREGGRSAGYVYRSVTASSGAGSGEFDAKSTASSIVDFTFASMSFSCL